MTGSSLTELPASVELSADSMLMRTVSYPLTAMVYDAADNALTDQAIQWSTDDPTGLQVSEPGILRAVAAGRYVVTARVNDLPDIITVHVVGGEPAALALAPAPAGVAAAETISLTATIGDAEGRGLDPSCVNWGSSVPTLRPLRAPPGWERSPV